MPRLSPIPSSLSSIYIFWKLLLDALLLLRNQLDSLKQISSSKQFFTKIIFRQVHKRGRANTAAMFSGEARYLGKRGRTNRSRANRSRAGLIEDGHDLFSFCENESTFSRSTPSRFVGINFNEHRWRDLCTLSTATVETRDFLSIDR